MARYVDDSIDYMNRYKSSIPPVIAVLAVVGLGRLARLATVGLAIAWAAHELREMDRTRSARGPHRKADKLVDTAMEDSVPASDPPSYSASSAGTPDDQGRFVGTAPVNQVH
jgi:hypothetical protein